jgi:DNA repair protein RecN (Recombination protein N)
VLSELRVRELGVIEDLALVFGPGMTAVTGETGAGKTLVVDAIELLVGGRAEGARVRGGAVEAVVEGRFTMPPDVPADGPAVGQAEEAADGEGAEEVVLSRVVPTDGRSRAYLDGRMATAGALAEVGARLVDLHGQHTHQALLDAPSQRDALDSFAGVDRRPRELARAKLNEVEAAIASAGGRADDRRRELDLLAYQLAELEAASLEGPAEDSALAEEEERLARAGAHREAAQGAYEGLSGEDQLLDRLGRVTAALAGHPPLAQLHGRLRGLAVELEDVAGELRVAGESLEDDPERLAEVVARRSLLRDLRRKYAGPGGGLDSVLEFYAQAAKRLEDLKDGEHRAARLEHEHLDALDGLRQACAEIGRRRRAAAAPLARAVQEELRRLAMPRALFEVQVGAGGEEARNEEGLAPGGLPASSGPDARYEPARMAELAGDAVTFLLAANPGEAPLPLSKVASGGELARAMLALRLVISRLSERAEGTSPAGGQRAGPAQGAGNSPAGEVGAGGPVGAEVPRTLVFDEVDAGVGGEAALAVGRALASLARRHQVIVVTHLAQVAAFADAQIAVTKVETAGRSVALAAPVDGQGRVVELSRMLSGQPGSETARRHAEELLASVRPAGSRESGSRRRA